MKRIYPTLALPLPRGGNKISDLPPLQGGIKGGKSDLRVLQGIFLLGNLLKLFVEIKATQGAKRRQYCLSRYPKQINHVHI